MKLLALWLTQLPYRMTLFKRTQSTVAEVEKAIEGLETQTIGSIEDPKESKKQLVGTIPCLVSFRL